MAEARRHGDGDAAVAIGCPVVEHPGEALRAAATAGPAVRALLTHCREALPAPIGTAPA